MVQHPRQRARCPQQTAWGKAPEQSGRRTLSLQLWRLERQLVGTVRICCPHRIPWSAERTLEAPRSPLRTPSHRGIRGTHIQPVAQASPHHTHQEQSPDPSRRPARRSQQASPQPQNVAKKVAGGLTTACRCCAGRQLTLQGASHCQLRATSHWSRESCPAVPPGPVGSREPGE